MVGNLRDRLGLRRPARAERRWQAETQALRGALSAGDFEAAWAEGAEWPIDRAISSARSVQAAEPAVTAC
jgi:hypothetical protein